MSFEGSHHTDKVLLAFHSVKFTHLQDTHTHTHTQVLGLGGIFTRECLWREQKCCLAFTRCPLSGDQGILLTHLIRSYNMSRRKAQLFTFLT